MFNAIALCVGMLSSYPIYKIAKNRHLFINLSMSIFYFILIMIPISQTYPAVEFWQWIYFYWMIGVMMAGAILDIKI